MLHRFLHLSDIHLGQEKDGTLVNGVGSAMIPFPLRASELKGVEEGRTGDDLAMILGGAGAGRTLVMLPGLGHAARRWYKYRSLRDCTTSSG